MRAGWFSWTIAFAICLSTALIGVETWRMWNVREASLRNAKIVTAGLAESISLQAGTTLKTADTVVASIGQRVEAEGVGPEALQRLYGLMTSLARALPAIHEMGITDRHGNALVKSLVPKPVGMNYSERDYFRYLSTHDTREVFIGAPVKSKVDGSLNVTISRRINNPDGSFAGIVVSSVSMDFFRKLFESVQAKSGGLIALVADSGALLARSPDSFGEGDLAALLQTPIDALEYVSPGSGAYRVGSYSRLSSYPMVVVVAKDSDDILHEWRYEMRTQVAVVLCILVVIAVLGYRLDRANRETQMQALRDTLTGLPNRRCLDATADLEFRRAARRNEAISFVMADIDLFKSFNDNYGHPAGDACLRHVADAIKGVLRRPGDMAARLGGEEIAILLPDTDTQGALRVAEAAQQAVQSLAIRHQSSPHRVVTLSFGVATCRPADGTATWQMLVAAADRALYAAKANGRNVVALDESPSIVPAAAAESAATPVPSV